jgi:glutamine amidotransferase
MLRHRLTPGGPGPKLCGMCRVVGYLGRPISLDSILFATDSSLARQTYSPRMMATFLNLAGFGMAAWDDRSARPEEPFLYKVTSLPVFDRNLKCIAEKVTAKCVIAHVRGVTYSDQEVVSQTNLHPFRFSGVKATFAHNGHLREFARMRYDLVRHVHPDFVSQIEGTTDSEWIYALLLSQLEDPLGSPDADEIADATVRSLRILRSVREKHEIATSSPANLFVSTGTCLVATRFSFDYGWYPDDDKMLETDLPYVSLWYTLGEEYRERDGEWQMGSSERPESLLIASEPLTTDTSRWLEAPEYSILTATLVDGGLETKIADLDA